MKLRKNWKRFFSLNRHHAEGFTLVELIVVIAILAILGGVAVPAYSGYVAKAERAGDEQLLAAVNQAFAAACAINGTDHHNLTQTPSITLAGNEGAKTVDAVSIYDDAFKTFYEGGEFKVFSYLKFENGMFVEGNAVFNKVLQMLLDEHGGDIEKLAASIFDDAGMAELMGKVDFAAALASAIASGDETGSSKLTQLLLDPSNLENLSQMLGYGSYVDAEGNVNLEFETALEDLITKRAEVLAQKNGGTVEDWVDIASADVMSNNAVLIAATKSTFDTETFASQLASGAGKSTILDTMKTDTQTALSQSALAYAMYTGYAARNNIDTSNVDINTVLNALASDDTSEGSFRYYMNSTEAETDMAGYLASMKMLDSSANSDPNAISNILVNGFADPDLVAMLQQAANSGSSN